VNFDGAATFGGASLQNELNRVSTAQNLTLRYRLTPLTTIVVESGLLRDRFEFNPLRDADSATVSVGALFDKFALLKGSARFGFRHFSPLVAGVPDYNGTTALVDLSYVARGVTRLTLGLDRNLNYSYDINQPYFVQTGAKLSVGQQVFRGIDAIGSLATSSLTYRDRAGASITALGRSDVVRSMQLGIGYRLGVNLRVGLNLDKQRRTSVVASRNYDNVRIGSAVTYVF
jgi:hypothetical protein